MSCLYWKIKKHILIVHIFIFFGLFVNAQVARRRDDKWPPPQLYVEFGATKAECTAESGVTNELVKKFSDGPNFEDPKLKRYMLCMLLKTKLFNADGSTNATAAMEGMVRAGISDEDQLVLIKLGISCTKIKAKDLYEKAYQTHVCMKKKDPVNYFIL